MSIFFGELGWFIFACMGIGAVVGLLAGLLGIGGGLLVVPALSFLLPMVNIPAQMVMPMALATSLASIVITSASSSLSHYRYGNIHIVMAKKLLPGILIGGVLGAMIADYLPDQYLSKIFGVIVLLLSLQMYLSQNQKVAVTERKSSAFSHIIAGNIIGIISSLAGIGGGSLTVPYISRQGIDMRKAIGTSSLCGAFLALSGMSGFIFFGLKQPETLPSYSLGYVYLPALFSLVFTSVITTNYGAKLASRLPTRTIKRIFALFLFCVGATMFFK